MPHKKGAADKALELKEFSFDYCFPGDTGGVAPLTVLVVRERLTKMLLAAGVPKKGPDKGNGVAGHNLHRGAWPCTLGRHHEGGS